MPLSLPHLQAVSLILDPTQPGGSARRRRFMDVVTFGTQWDTQVGDTAADAPGAQPIEFCRKVAQIYCSALPVSYNKFPQHEWTHFATAVLQAAYEATLAAAANLSAQRSGARVMVFLTRVGGGAWRCAVRVVSACVYVSFACTCAHDANRCAASHALTQHSLQERSAMIQLGLKPPSPPHVTGITPPPYPSPCPPPP